ncbi:MAG: CoA transferase, partial [Dehalococcoidia bacterium]
WARLCAEVLLHPEWTEDPRFVRNELRVTNRDVLEPMIEAALAEVSLEEAEARLEAASLAFARANEARDVFDHPQVLARGRRLRAGSPAGPVDLLRAPFNIEGLAEPERTIPAVGEHTDAILRELGYDTAAITDLHGDGVV